jgi:excisionase family DNA binding protein
VKRRRTDGSSRPGTDPAGNSVLIEQAMEILGVSKRTVYYWIRQGRLQTLRVHGSQRVLVGSIQDVVVSHPPAPMRPLPTESLGGFAS